MSSGLRLALRRSRLVRRSSAPVKEESHDRRSQLLRRQARTSQQARQADEGGGRGRSGTEEPPCADRLTGDFNRVILEYEAENVGEFEQRMRDYATNQAFRDKMQGYTDLYITGSREILQIV